MLSSFRTKCARPESKKSGSAVQGRRAAKRSGVSPGLWMLFATLARARQEGRKKAREALLAPLPWAVCESARSHPAFPRR